MSVKTFDVTLVEYDDPEEIVERYFAALYPALGRVDLFKKPAKLEQMFMVDVSGWTIGEVAKLIAEQGSWAFTGREPGKKRCSQIHYWISKETEFEEVLEIFSHELAHIAGYSREITAAKIAAISVNAYMMAVANIENSNRK